MKEIPLFDGFLDIFMEELIFGMLLDGLFVFFEEILVLVLNDVELIMLSLAL